MIEKDHQNGSFNPFIDLSMLCLNIADFFSSEHFLSRAKANHHRFFLSFLCCFFHKYPLVGTEIFFVTEAARTRTVGSDIVLVWEKNSKMKFLQAVRMALCTSRLHSFDVWLSFFFYPHPNLQSLLERMPKTWPSPSLTQAYKDTYV